MANTQISTNELQGRAYLRSEQAVTLRLQLGEFAFSRKSFRSVVLHFELGERPELDALAAANLESGSYDLVFFPSADATLRTRMLRVCAGKLWYSPGSFPLYCVDLKGSFEDYRRHFSKSVRSHLKRDREKFRQLSGSGEYFREYRRPEEMKEFFCAARSISAKSYQERLLGAGLPDTPEFLEELIERAEKDLIRAYILYDKDQPAAFGYSSGRGSRLTYHVTGYDPAYADFSPGRVLLYCMLERLFTEKRFELFDFDMGEAIYKSVFSTHALTCADMYCFRLSVKNSAFVMARVGLATLSRTLVRLTRALGVKDRLKKWSRNNFRRVANAPKPAV